MTDNLSPETLATIHKAAFGNNAWDTNAFATLLDKPTHFIYGDEHGFILWQEVAGEAEILTLAVVPLKQKQGRGFDILSAALGQMHKRQIQKVHLEVAAHNRAAQALYIKAGFVKNGRRAHYYSKNDSGENDAILMIFCF